MSRGSQKAQPRGSVRQFWRLVWLGVCLLPWLVDAAGHDMMHSATCPEVTLLQHLAPTRTHTVGMEAGVLPEAAESECLASLWAANAIGHHATPLLLSLARQVLAREAIALPEAPDRVFARLSVIRGPPVS